MSRATGQVGPLYLLAGGQAAGKSTLLPHLVQLARGPIVMEMDELLDDGSLLGMPIGGPEGEASRQAYDQMWVKLTAMVRRAGHPVILLCPTPSPGAFETGSVFEPPVHWARLECSDRVRRARLRRRGWTQEQVDDFMSDPGHARIRTLIQIEFRTDDADPAVLAAEVLNWVTETGSRGR